MAKTEQTLAIERALIKQSREMRIFGSLEVTIGWFGRERVDYLTLDYKQTWRCYEIKVSKSDFNSKAAVTFLGHLNYYVMPADLYNQVKNDIPSQIGVKSLDKWGSVVCLKQARRQTITPESERLLYNSLVRCLCRDRDALAKRFT